MYSRSPSIYTTPDEMRDDKLTEGRSSIGTRMETEDDGNLEIGYCDRCGRESTSALTVDDQARIVFAKIYHTFLARDRPGLLYDMDLEEMKHELEFSHAALDSLVEKQDSIISALAAAEASQTPAAEKGCGSPAKDYNLKRAGQRWWSVHELWESRRNVAATNLRVKRGGQCAPVRRTYRKAEDCNAEAQNCLAGIFRSAAISGTGRVRSRMRLDGSSGDYRRTYGHDVVLGHSRTVVRSRCSCIDRRYHVIQDELECTYRVHFDGGGQD